MSWLPSASTSRRRRHHDHAWRRRDTDVHSIYEGFNLSSQDTISMPGLWWWMTDGRDDGGDSSVRSTTQNTTISLGSHTIQWYRTLMFLWRRWPNCKKRAHRRLSNATIINRLLLAREQYIVAVSYDRPSQSVSQSVSSKKQTTNPPHRQSHHKYSSQRQNWRYTTTIRYTARIHSSSVLCVRTTSVAEESISPKKEYYKGVYEGVVWCQHLFRIRPTSRESEWVSEWASGCGSHRERDEKERRKAYTTWRTVSTEGFKTIYSTYILLALF